MTDRDGRPVAVEVYAGNTGDPTTVVDQVNKLRQRFHLSRVVLVGDRGMLTSERAEQLSAADTVRGYKSLARVERAFRSLKGRSSAANAIQSVTEAEFRSSFISFYLAILRGRPLYSGF